MAIVKKRFKRGLILKADDIGVDGIEGELKVGATSKELHVYLDSALRSIVTENQVQTLTSKTIDADLNTISNLEVTELKAGVLNTSTTLASASDTQLPSALAVKTYVDNKAAAQDQASEISVAAIPGLTATNVQDALSQIDTNVDTNSANLSAHLTDTLDAHAASAITNVPVGNTAATTVQGAINELQGDIDAINADIADDVEGPISSTDNAVPRFDGITGKLLQASGVIVNDLNQITGVDTLTAATSVKGGNIRLNGNGVINDSAGANLLLTPTGAGKVQSFGDHQVDGGFITGTDDDATVGVDASIDITGKALIRLTGVTLTSIASITGGVDGQNITLINGANTITLKRNAGTVGNSILTDVSVGDLSIPPYGQIRLSYNSTHTAWLTDAGIANTKLHTSDTTDAHTASAITNVPAGNLAGTTVQAALNELQTDVDSRALQTSLDTTNTNLSNHLADTIDAHDASAISSVPAGNLAATDVQGALNELQTDIDTRATSTALSTHEADTTAIHGIADTSLLVTTTGTQTLSNKSFSDAVALPELAGTPVNPAAGSQKIYMKADGKFYKLTSAGVETEVGSGSGSGGTPDADVLLTQNFDTAALTDFTQTGLTLPTTSTINGAKSACLTHAGASSVSFKQTNISVPHKFRNVNMTGYAVIRSTATSGNVTLTITDETSAVTLQTLSLQTDSNSISATTAADSPTITGISSSDMAKLQIGQSITGTGIAAGTVIFDIPSTSTITLSQNATAAGTVTLRVSALPKTLQFGFKIPDDCLAISYTVTGLQEAGSPETYIDDIKFASYWMGSSNQGQSEILVPTITTQSSYIQQTTTFGVATITGATTSTAGASTLYSYNSGTGVYTALVDLKLDLSFTLSGVTSTAQPVIQVNGVDVSITTAPVGTWDECSWSGPILSGQTFLFNNTAGSTNGQRISVSAQAVTTSSVTTTDLVPAKAVLGNSTFDVPVVTDWASYTPTFTGFGTPTGVEAQWRRNGANHEYRVKFVSGTPTAVEARVGLANGATSAAASVIPSIQNVGKSIRGSATANQSKQHAILIEPSVAYMTIGSDDTSVATSPFTKRNGDAVLLAGEPFSFFASVPIAGLSATDEITVSGTQQLLKSENDSIIRLDTPNGYGSTNTVIRRFSNIRQNLGSDVTYNDSATLGASFTINTSGTYSISYSDEFNAIASLGLSLNSTQLTTAIPTITAANRLAIDTVGGASHAGNVSWTGYLTAGDVIRPHTNGTASGGNVIASFAITKEASISVLNTTSDQKIEIPTSELRFEGSSSRGSTDTAIVKFDTLAKIRGDAFTVTNTAANGTYVTMKKAGKLDVSANLTLTSASLAITKNQTTLTDFPTLATEFLAAQGDAGTSIRQSITASAFVSVGDIIRVSTNATPGAGTGNSLQLSFQEQSVQVSVSNTLPQFSESDSSVHVDNSVAKGTGTYIPRFTNVRQNTGKDIEYTDSTTGAMFTVKSSGVYSVSFSWNANAASNIGISKNSTQLGTDIATINNADRLAISTSNTANYSETISWTGYLQAGDIVRPHTDAAAVGAGTEHRVSFIMAKVGKPNVTGVDVTPFVNVPQPVTETIHLNNGSAAVAVDIVNFGVAKTTASSLFSYIPSTGSIKFNKRCEVNCTFYARATAANDLYVVVRKNGTTLIQTNATGSSVGLNYDGNPVTLNYIFDAGDYLNFRSEGSACQGASVQLLATATSDQILTAPETFSTDTAPLSYSSTYTLATLKDAPVGTFITFLYNTVNSNTRTQTTTAPTQTTADMNTNGLLVYTRVYNATSTAAQPTTFAIQIGKGLKGVQLGLYKSVEKTIAGNLDKIVSGGNAYGAFSKDYNESTGIIIIDAGFTDVTNTGSHQFIFSDVTGQATGYLVINASKNPALTGVPVLLPRIATISDVKASGTAGGSSVAGWQTRVLNTLADPTGLITSLASNQFTLPAGEYYLDAVAPAYNVNSHILRIRNITDGIDSIVGNVGYMNSASNVQTNAEAHGKITIATSKTFELQHYTVTATATNGLGVDPNVGVAQVYSVVKITKVK